MGKRGPKAAGDFGSKGATLSARITTGTRHRLDDAAAASGRSLSQELEVRLVRSFDADEPETIKKFGSPETYALLRLAAEMVKNVEELTGQKWRLDRFTHDLVVIGIQLMLAAWQPSGDGEPPESFPNFVGYEQSPELRASFREGAARSIKIERGRFLTSFAGQIVTNMLALVQSAPATTDAQNKIYRNVADNIRAHLAQPAKSQVDRHLARIRKTEKRS